MVDYTNVSARAMLVSVQISMWSGYKHDKQATIKVNTDHGASPKASRVNKQLLPGAELLERLKSRAAHARNLHYANTLPWSDEGWRLLTSANFMTYSDAMRGAFQSIDETWNEFLDAYPQLKADAQQYSVALGRLWKDEDYPTVRQLRTKYSRSIEFLPVPSRGDIRCDLPADQIAVIEAQITQRAEQATRDAMNDAWKRIYEVVARIERATGPDGKIYDNLIDSTREVLAVVGRLNIAGDEHLDAFRDRITTELARLDVEALRDKQGATRTVARQKATEIMAAMSAFYAPQPDEDGGDSNQEAA